MKGFKISNFVGRMKICVVTVTLNAGHVLPGLIDSLKSQTDADFEWVVFDGGSTDSTVHLIRACGLGQVSLTCGRDFGIYDALNQAVASVKSDFYLVCGADDRLEPSAIADYSAAIRANPDSDVVCAVVNTDTGVTIRPRRNLGWLYGLPGIASSHAVGTLMRVNLHNDHGWYSRKLPIAADQLFLKKVHAAGGRFHYETFLAGTYGTSGTSGSDILGTILEIFRVQWQTESWKVFQLTLFVLRLLINFKKL